MVSAIITLRKMFYNYQVHGMGFTNIDEVR